MRNIMTLKLLPKIVFGFFLLVSLFFMDLSLSKTIQLIEVDGKTIAGIILFITANVLKYFRILVLVSYDRTRKKLGDVIDLRSSFQGFFATGLLILLLPFKLGEIFRIAFVAKFLNLPGTRALFTVATERFLDLAVLATICLTYVVFVSPITAFQIEYIVALIIGIPIFAYTILRTLRLLIAHYEIKYWDQPRRSFPEYIGKRLLDWNVIRINIERNLYTVLSYTFIAWVCEIVSIMLIFWNSGLSPNELFLLSMFCLLGFALPAGPASVGGIHIAFYSFQNLISQDFDINYANVYILYTHLALFLMLLLSLLWRPKFENNY